MMFKLRAKLNINVRFWPLILTVLVAITDVHGERQERKRQRRANRRSRRGYRPSKSQAVQARALTSQRASSIFSGIDAVAGRTTQARLGKTSNAVTESLSGSLRWYGDDDRRSGSQVAFDFAVVRISSLAPLRARGRLLRFRTHLMLTCNRTTWQALAAVII